MAAKQFPEWARILYRGVRGAVGAGLAQIVLLQPDWSVPQEALRTLAVAFLAGFIPAFGMYARDFLDKYFDQDEKSLIQRTMPI